jgi:hypothetical protein
MLASISAVIGKKEDISVTYTTDLELLEFYKNLVLSMLSLHCYCALLKVKTIKSFYLINYKR